MFDQHPRVVEEALGVAKVCAAGQWDLRSAHAELHGHLGSKFESNT